MLIELFGRNFGPFRDEFRLSLEAANIDPEVKGGVIEVPLEGEDEPLRLLRCAAIYGPNASGKSSVLLAAAALGFLLSRSATFESDQPIPPYEPFLLDEWSERPVMLGVRGVVKGRVYEYAVEFDKSRFVLERLVECGPEKDEVLFKRDNQEVSGSWTTEKQFNLFSDSFRPNALLLSLADRFAPTLASGLSVGLRELLGHHDFASGASWFGVGNVAERATKDASAFGDWLRDWIRHADVGVVDYDTVGITHSPRPEEEGKTASLPRKPKMWMFKLKHAGPREPVPFHYGQESVGTHKMIELAPYIYDLTHGDTDRAIFVDEMGASVHPALLTAVIRQFNRDTPDDRVRGQLIFAAHETALFEGETKSAPLRRDQVYFTEKDSTGASSLFSMVEFKERNNLNLRKRYLQGRYGALPAPGPMGG